MSTFTMGRTGSSWLASLPDKTIRVSGGCHAIVERLAKQYENGNNRALCNKIIRWFADLPMEDQMRALAPHPKWNAPVSDDDDDGDEQPIG